MRNSRFLLCMSCLFTVLVVLFSTPVRGQDSEPETTAQNAVTMFRANTLFKRGAFLEAALGEMTSLVEEAARFKERERYEEASRMFADLSGDANPVQQESTAIRADRLELYHEVARKLKDIKQDLENLCSSEEQDGCANEGLVKALKKFFDFLGDVFLNESDGPLAGDEGPDHPDTEISDLKMPDSDR